MNNCFEVNISQSFDPSVCNQWPNLSLSGDSRTEFWIALYQRPVVARLISPTGRGSSPERKANTRLSCHAVQTLLRRDLISRDQDQTYRIAGTWELQWVEQNA